MALIRHFPPGAVDTSSGLVRGVPGGGFEDVEAAGGGATGTLTSTLDGVTTSFSGTTTVLGTFGVTLDNVIAAFLGSPIVSGSISNTLESATTVFEGSVGSAVAGDIASTLESHITSLVGSPIVVGSIVNQLENSITAFSGNITVVGSFSNQLENANANFSGSAGGVLGVPANLAGTPTGNSIVWTWSSVATADGYEIEFGPDGGSYTVVDVGNNLTYTQTGLSTSTLYEARVRAYTGTIDNRVILESGYGYLLESGDSLLQEAA